jgi:hypothetical protein
LPGAEFPGDISWGIFTRAAAGDQRPSFLKNLMPLLTEVGMLRTQIAHGGSVSLWGRLQSHGRWHDNWNFNIVF